MSAPPVSDRVRCAAERLERLYGPHIAGLFAYGSRVYGRARAGSAYDFWMLVKDPAAFHQDNADFYRTRLNVPSTPERQIALNRTGPLFYALRSDDMEIKIAVLGEQEFVRLCRDRWWTVKGRMQKPLRIFRSTPELEAAILTARREGLACGLNLVHREFTMEDLLKAVVGLSYRAEVRPESKRAKVRSIVRSGRAELEAIYRPLLAELPYVETQGDAYLDRRHAEDRHRARAATYAALRHSKWCRHSRAFVWRNFCSHGSPVRYIALKVVGEIEKLARGAWRRLRAFGARRLPRRSKP